MSYDEVHVPLFASKDFINTVSLYTHTHTHTHTLVYHYTTIHNLYSTQCNTHYTLLLLNISSFCTCVLHVHLFRATCGWAWLCTWRACTHACIFCVSKNVIFNVKSLSVYIAIGVGTRLLDLVYFEPLYVLLLTPASFFDWIIIVFLCFYYHLWSRPVQPWLRVIV